MQTINNIVGEFDRFFDRHTFNGCLAPLLTRPVAGPYVNSSQTPHANVGPLENVAR